MQAPLQGPMPRGEDGGNLGSGLGWIEGCGPHPLTGAAPVEGGSPWRGGMPLVGAPFVGVRVQRRTAIGWVPGRVVGALPGPLLDGERGYVASFIDGAEVDLLESEVRLWATAGATSETAPVGIIAAAGAAVSAGAIGPALSPIAPAGHQPPASCWLWRGKRHVRHVNFPTAGGIDPVVEQRDRGRKWRKWHWAPAPLPHPNFRLTMGYLPEQSLVTATSTHPATEVPAALWALQRATKLQRFMWERVCCLSALLFIFLFVGMVSHIIATPSFSDLLIEDYSDSASSAKSHGTVPVWGFGGSLELDAAIDDPVLGIDAWVPEPYSSPGTLVHGVAAAPRVAAPPGPVGRPGFAAGLPPPGVLDALAAANLDSDGIHAASLDKLGVVWSRLPLYGLFLAAVVAAVHVLHHGAHIAANFAQSVLHNGGCGGMPGLRVVCGAPQHCVVPPPSGSMPPPSDSVKLPPFGVISPPPPPHHGESFPDVMPLLGGSPPSPSDVEPQLPLAEWDDAGKLENRTLSHSSPFTATVSVSPPALVGAAEKEGEEGLTLARQGTGAVVVGANYVAVARGVAGVVRAVGLGAQPGAAVVVPCHRTRIGTYRQGKPEATVEVAAADLKVGPFFIHAGRPPAFVEYGLRRVQLQVASEG